MNSTPSTRKNNLTKSEDPNMIFFDPTLIEAARNIYRKYYSLGVSANSQPMGIVINRDSHRGQLAFKNKPVLLPRECFIPIGQIEADTY
ncbi:hypothetical protein [Pleurocapsa sp. FMAR1]|uniref:hypothetical protein n=1 Tax=Pleurocapsa sp. FMAR1 TaxID=3040204 RepID=UPI0029C675D7|nr:hypothetical protein [Pleurocapsa sp. FMAR1]